MTFRDSSRLYCSVIKCIFIEVLSIVLISSGGNSCVSNSRPCLWHCSCSFRRRFLPRARTMPAPRCRRSLLHMQNITAPRRARKRSGPQSPGKRRSLRRIALSFLHELSTRADRELCISWSRALSSSCSARSKNLRRSYARNEFTTVGQKKTAVAKMPTAALIFSVKIFEENLSSSLSWPVRTLRRRFPRRRNHRRIHRHLIEVQQERLRIVAHQRSGELDRIAFLHSRRVRLHGRRRLRLIRIRSRCACSASSRS